MPPVQTTYSENIAAARAGMVGNETNWDADTRIVETAAGIGFGLACGQGSTDKGVVLGAGSGFVGVSLRDVTLEPGDADTYQEGANMAVLTEGDIWVTVGGPVSAGDDVTFNNATGVMSTVVADVSNTAIAGARWMTSAAQGALALLRLKGPLPG